MKNSIINTTLILTAILFLAALAVRVRTGATADSVAVLKTAGMTCGSCADKICEVLQGVRGVASTQVDLDGGRVIVGYDTKAVKPEILAENVKKAGFDSTVQQVVTPDRYRQMTGKDFGTAGAARSGGCIWCESGTKPE
ncbi:heavy-metal-associated domain-containing protein [Geobacter sp. AOG2]|uniref:heavy-metal-associated domain-containing protein n=1 Tax=Geobacter sp. AOG2 TaxID=1566347 RepID=UPI001CC4C488|nr:heavy-metal-associated domain-containing protein [Geobacter sp. AOG2]GFE62533.1 heavy metal transporter [Geobacter sp. AOG2]